MKDNDRKFSERIEMKCQVKGCKEKDTEKFMLWRFCSKHKNASLRIPRGADRYGAEPWEEGVTEEEIRAIPLGRR